MRKTITTTAVLALISLTACASGPKLTTVTEAQDVSTPVVGVSTSINIGEKLYTKDDRVVTRYMVIPTNVKVTFSGGMFDGTEATLNINSDRTEMYYLISEYPAKEACAYEIILTCYKDTDGDEVIDSVYRGAELDKVYKIINPFPIKYYNKVQGTGGTWFELIYSGKTKDTMKVTYREFTGSNLIRDAFTQYLEYPVENGEVQIDFKGISLKITEIKGSRITYTRTQ